MNEFIQCTIKYIDDHLDEDLSIEHLAERVNYSPYYFQRVFSTVAQTPIKTYIRERRLTRAAFDLLNTEDHILEIAYRYGFSTHESFTKSLKKQHGVTPSTFRKNNLYFNATRPLYDVSKKKEGKRMNVRIEKNVNVIVSGERYKISLKNDENLNLIPKLWDDVNLNKRDHIYFEQNDGAIKGVMGVCRKLNDYEIEYWIGSSVLEKQTDSLIIEASDYAVFEVIGPLPDAIQKGWTEIMNEWIPTSDYVVDETFDFEVYSEDDPFSEDLKSEIWIKLKQ